VRAPERYDCLRVSTNPHKRPQPLGLFALSVPNGAANLVMDVALNILRRVEQCYTSFCMTVRVDYLCLLASG
jgi:hypothetical protein